MNTKNKVLLSSLISMAVLSLTACGGGDSTDPIAQHPDPDFFSPNIKLNGGGGDVVIEEGTIYIDEGATASDNVDGDNVNVTTSGFVNADTAGTYTLTYSATDVAGNSAEATRTIKVIRGEDFNDYNGKWITGCLPASVSTRPNIKYMIKVISVENRNISLHARAYGEDDSTCTGEALSKGTVRGRVVYTGHVLDGSYSGEKIDVTAQDAFLNGDEIQIQALKNLIPETFPEFDILTRPVPGDKLFTGDRSAGKNATSNEMRPVSFNISEVFKLKQ